MKNFKKLVLAIGTLATTITPVVTIISCGSEVKETKKETGQNGEIGATQETGGKQETGVTQETGGKQGTSGNKVVGGNVETTGNEVSGSSSVVFDHINSMDALIWAIKNGNIEIILESIKNISPEDVKAFLKTITIEKTKVLFKALTEQSTDINGKTSSFMAKLVQAFKSDSDLANTKIFKDGFDIEKQEYIDAIANVFGLFKKGIPEISSIDDNAFAASLMDLLGNGLDLESTSIDILASFSKVLFPEYSETIDAIGNFVKISTTKSISKVPTNNLKLIFSLIKPLLSSTQATTGSSLTSSTLIDVIEKALDTNIFEKLLGHMADKVDEDGNLVYVKDENGQDTSVVEQEQIGYGWDNRNDFADDLRKILPNSLLTEKYKTAGYTVSFESLMLGIYDSYKNFPITHEDYFVKDTGKTINFALGYLLMYGLKPGSITSLLFSIVYLDGWDSIKAGLPNGFGDIIDKLKEADDPYEYDDNYKAADDFPTKLSWDTLGNPGKISTTIYNIFKNPLTSLTVDDFKNIIQVINIVTKTNISPEVGDAIYNVIHHPIDSSLENVSHVLDLVKQLMPSTSSVLDAIETMIPIFMVGNDKVKSEETDIVAEFAKIKAQLSESTIGVGTLMPEEFDENTYSNLMNQFNEQAKHIEEYDPLRAHYALSKIKAIKVEMDNYNVIIDALNVSRDDFITNYGPSHEVTPMNAITATDHKLLDNAYDAVKAKLEELYKTNVANMFVDDINLVSSKIANLEPIITELNDSITTLNGDATTDVKSILEKIKTLGIIVDGVSPISKAAFDAFKLEFNATDDAKGDNSGHPVFSNKSAMLGKFIDDNSLALFGSEVSPNFRLFTQLSFVNTFEKLGTQDYEILKHSNSVNGNVEEFISNIIMKIMLPENFAKLQEFVLKPLGYTIITDTEINNAISITGESKLGVLTITNPIGATITADKMNGLANGDKIKLDIVYAASALGSATITYVVSDLVLSDVDQLAAKFNELTGMAISPKATHVDGVVEPTEVYPSYTQPELSSFTTVAEVTAEIAEKQKAIDAANTYNIAYAEAVKVKETNDEINAKFNELTGMTISPKATHVDGVVEPTEAYPSYTQPELSSFTTVAEVTAEIAEKQKATDAANAYNTAYARAMFTKNYSSAQVADMNAITATDHKDLDTSYDAVKAKLEELYNTDITNLSTEDIDEVSSQIMSWEPIITELNDLITELNKGSAIDTQPILEKIKNLKADTTEELSSIDKVAFDTFKLEFDAADDVKRDSGGKPIWSVKAELLGKFIDDNSKDIFGEDWVMPILKDVLGNNSWSWDHNFLDAALDKYSGNDLKRVKPDDDFSAKSFLDYVIERALTTEDFAKLQEFVLDPLGL